MHHAMCSMQHATTQHYKLATTQRSGQNEPAVATYCNDAMLLDATMQHAILTLYDDDYRHRQDRTLSHCATIKATNWHGRH